VPPTLTTIGAAREAWNWGGELAGAQPDRVPQRVGVSQSSGIADESKVMADVDIDVDEAQDADVTAGTFAGVDIEIVQRVDHHRFGIRTADHGGGGGIGV